MKQSTILSQKLYEATLGMLNGDINPLHLSAAVRASNALIRLSLGDSFHQRMKKQVPHVPFFDDDVECVAMLPPVVTLEVATSVKPMLTGRRKSNHG
jgi:hypothetical protein